MISRFLVICALSLCQQTLFSHNGPSKEPRAYDPPPFVPHTNCMVEVDFTMYKSKFSKPDPEWLKETLDNELGFFRKHRITQKALNATYDKIVSHGYPQTHYLRRYRVIGNRIYAYGVVGETHADLTMRTLARMSDWPGIPELPNVDIILNNNDGMPMFYDPPEFWITEDEEDQAPVLSGGKRATAPFVIVIPHNFPMEDWARMCQKTLKARCPWNRKVRSVCWRGNIVLADTDIMSAPDQALLEAFSNSPRCLLPALSQIYPGYINAGFYASLDWIPSKALRDLVTPLIKGFISFEEHIKYAYLPILDGAMISGSGYEWRLLSNSLVFKPDSLDVAWFEKGMKPYVHYLPIRRDMEDIIEKIEWARSHDKECEQMANNGAAFASEHLTLAGLYFYLFRLFQEYEKCQTFNTVDLLYECEHDKNWTLIR